MTDNYPLPPEADPPCRKAPEVMFPVASSPRALDAAVERAKAVCRGCPFSDPCLAYSLRFRVDGIWAGTTERERQALRDSAKVVPLPVIISAYSMRAFHARVSDAS